MQKTARYCFALLLLLSACKKDKDKEPPFIQIDAPLRNASFQAGDLVRVTGTVSDNKKLESVTLKLLSIDGNTQLAEPVSLDISGKELQVDHTLKVGDIHTTSGVY